eukprot:scaffold3542_cov54-Phaeocystis_antarctica.AAC.5
MRAVKPFCGGAAAAPHAVSGGGEGGAAGAAGGEGGGRGRRGAGGTAGGAALTLSAAFTFTPSSARRLRVARSPSFAASIRASSACGRSHPPSAHRRSKGARRVRVGTLAAGFQAQGYSELGFGDRAEPGTQGQSHVSSGPRQRGSGPRQRVLSMCWAMRIQGYGVMCGLWIGMGRVRVVSWAILSSPRRAGTQRRRGGQPLARPSGCCSPVSFLPDVSRRTLFAQYQTDAWTLWQADEGDK